MNSGKAIPLLCGSALRNKGIQPILDSVIKYLPSPETKDAIAVDPITKKTVVIKPNLKGKLVALAFKVVNDKEKGLVTFFRVYSGLEFILV